MNTLKRKMIAEAQRKYSRIFPCSSRRTLNECFTVEDDQIIFWFNTEDATTHTMTKDLV
jgi:hypothetical protein